LNSDLIVQVKIEKGNEKRFVAHITDVLYAEDDVYYPGKNLFVTNILSVGCGEPFDIYQMDTVVLALQSDQGVWRVTHAEYIPEVKNGKAQLVQFCPNTDYNMRQWKKEIQTLFATFERQSAQVVIPKFSLPYFHEHYTQAPWVGFLYQWYNNAALKSPNYNCGAKFWYYDKEDDSVITATQQTVAQDTICATPPHFSEEQMLDLNEVSHAIWLQHKRAFAASGIEGKFYVSSQVAKDGRLYHSKVIRSIYPPADADIVEAVEEQLQVSPGTNSNNEPIDCEIRYAITIRIIH
jgi:asparagine N-glycosylation enzyme membrane subunit Stt3